MISIPCAPACVARRYTAPGHASVRIGKPGIIGNDALHTLMKSSVVCIPRILCNDCPAAHLWPGSLGAKEVFHLVMLARSAFSRNYNRIVSYREEEDILVQIDLRPLLTGQMVKAHVLALDDERKERKSSYAPHERSKLFDIEVFFMHDGRSCMRRILFINEHQAGRMRFSYRLLTEAFFGASTCLRCV